MKKIGQGASRAVYLTNEGIVVKKPNYNYYFNRIGCGSTGGMTYKTLVTLTKDDPKVKKVLELEKEGRRLYSSCRNNFVEYMVSLILNEEEKRGFAVCFDIRVRRSPHPEKISVVGFYENAKKKKRDINCSGYRKFESRTGFEIDDLHHRNFVNGIVVDYAAIC